MSFAKSKSRVFCASMMMLTVLVSTFIGASIGANAQLTNALSAVEPIPAVAIQVSQDTSNHWTITSWNYFSLYEMVEDIFKGDGTPYVEVSDADIASGALMNSGVPKYPILFSMAAECISDTAASQVAAYVSAGGFAFVGSSSWTKYPTGTARTDFALASQMGVSCISSPPGDYVAAGTYDRKVADSRLIDYMANINAGANINWWLPLTKDTAGYGESSSHYVWAAQATTTAPADILLTTSEGYLTLATKAYAGGRFIYDSEMAPLADWCIWGPTTYEYLMFKNAVNWAFESNGVPLVRLSPWQYQYNAACIFRHDICRDGATTSGYGFNWMNPSNTYLGVTGSSQTDKTLGVISEIYVVTGETRDPGSASVPYGYTPEQLIADLQGAAALGTRLVSHNGGLPSTPWTGITNPADNNMYHWGLDMAEYHYPSDPTYANRSLSISLDDLQSWLGTRPTQFGEPNGAGGSETTFQFEEENGIKIDGDKDIGNLPNFALSMNTPNKNYDIMMLPYTDYYLSSGAEMIHMDIGYCTTDLIKSCVDMYYNQGLFINIVGHRPSWTTLYYTYITYCLSKPYMWNATSPQIRDWLLVKQPVTMNPTYQVLPDGEREITATLSGSASADIALDMNIPVPQSRVYDFHVKLDGNPSTDYRQTTSGVKIKAGTASTVTITYRQLDTKTWTQTSQADFQSGTLTNLDTSSNPGQLQLPSQSTADTVFSDDFSDASWTNSHWTVYKGTWTVVNGVYHQSDTVNFPPLVYTSDTSWRDYAITATARYISGTYGFATSGRLNPATGSRYTVLTYPTSQGGPNQASLVKVSDYASSSLTTLGSATVATDTNWHTTRLEFSGSTIKWYYDGALKITATDSSYLTGAMCLETAYAQVDFDNVTVQAPGTLFSDSFSDASWTNSHWTVKSAPDDGTWTVESAGTYNQTTLNIASPSLSYAGSTSWTNYAVEAKVRWVDGWYGPWLGGRLDPTTGHRYVFYTYPTNNNPNYPGVHQDLVGLASFGNFGTPGGAAIAPEATVSFHDNNSWHIMRMEFSGTTIKCYWDGALVITATNSLYSAGAVDVETWLNSTAEFDYVTVQALTTQTYISPGTLVSSAFDAGQKSSWLTISWNGFKPANTNIQFRTRTAATQAALTSATWSSYYTTSGSDVTGADNEWIQYEATLSTTDSSATPIVNDVSLVYSDGWLRWKQTTKADFESGTLTNLDTASVPDQVSLAGGGPAILFSDDFSDPAWTSTHWTVYKGTWAVISGVYDQSDTNQANFPQISYAGSTSWSDYTMNATARYISGTFGPGISGRLNPTTGSRYNVLVYTTSTGGPNTARLIKVADYASSWLDVMGQATITTDTNWHNESLVFSGNTIKWYYDGVLKISATDPGNQYHGAAFTTGAIDLETPYSHVAYDNVTVQGTTPSGFAASGTLVSSAFDTGTTASWLPIAWNASTPTGTNIQFRTRTAPTQAELSTASWSGYYPASNLFGIMITSPPNRWIQYEATLSTSNSAVTPTLYDVTIYYEGPPRFLIDPSTIAKTPSDVGTTFSVNVALTNVQDLWGFDFNLTWDNNLLTLASVNYNSALDDMWGSGHWFAGTNTTGPGYYELAAVSTSTDFNGTDILATLEFRVELPLSNQPVQTLIHFQTHKLSNSQWTAIVHEVADATYTITGQVPTLQLSPTSVTCRMDNEQFQVEITVSDAYNIEDLHFEVHFDTTLLNCTGVVWTQWGSGTATVDETNGKVIGSTSGTAANGTRILIALEFTVNYTRIWKSIPGWTNDISGTIYLRAASLSYSTGPDLAYARGGLNQINVGPDVTFTFSPIKGDIDNSGEVDITDLRTVSYYYDVKEGDSLWGEAQKYDLTKPTSENIIDIYDLVIIATNFGYKYP